MADCRRFFEQEDYFDILYRRSEVADPDASEFSEFCFTQINERWGIIHIPLTEAGELTYERYGYTSFPLVYSIQDYGAMNAAGITRAQEQPFLNLRGEGTLIGIVDTGIKYDHEVFINADNTSRIEVIWDQTKAEEEDNLSQPFFNSAQEIAALVAYGKVYDRNVINAALNAKLSGDNPLEIVDVTDDEDGHGTFMAGVAAGNPVPEKNFTGAATQAGIAVVKLKSAKNYIKEFYSIRNDVTCYSETDIIMGVKFLNEYARLVNKPISIIIGLGTNLSGHRGNTVLSAYLNDVGLDFGRSICTCVGNYAASRLHFRGRLENDMRYVPVEIKVGENERGFVMNLWSEPPDIYALEFVSPLGQVASKIPVRVNRDNTVNFNLEGTRLSVYYGINQAVTGQNLASVTFVTPSEGIWTVRVYGENVLRGEFDVWLSNKEFMSSDTYFLQSDPFDTMTDPGNAQVPIAVGAYDYRDGSVYLGSGRGVNYRGGIVPDILAPGVNIMGPSSVRDNAYVVKTGSSVAAAIAGGGCALILQYGIVKGFYPYMRSYTVKNYLISGADRREGEDYPDALRGYGGMNVYRAIENIRR